MADLKFVHFIIYIYTVNSTLKTVFEGQAEYFLKRNKE